MIVFFDTVKRKRPVRESGNLVKLDWDRQEILNQIPIFPTDPDILDDPNPRGNSRGGKGLAIRGDELFAATYHSLLVYDFNLKLKRKISNPLFVNLHEICPVKDEIWVSSTAIDAAVLVDGAGHTLRSFWPREVPILQERFGFFPLNMDKAADNRLRHLHDAPSQKEGHTHLNSVFCLGKRTFVLLNRPGAVVQIEPEVRLIVQHESLKGGHSPVVTQDGRRLLVCGTQSSCLLSFDLENGRLQQTLSLTTFPEVARIKAASPDQPFNKAIFLRGLELIAPGRVLVGISPASILEIDVETERLINLFQYSHDVGDAVHGLVHRPRESHHAQL